MFETKVIIQEKKYIKFNYMLFFVDKSLTKYLKQINSLILILILKFLLSYSKSIHSTVSKLYSSWHFLCLNFIYRLFSSTSGL